MDNKWDMLPSLPLGERQSLSHSFLTKGEARKRGSAGRWISRVARCSCCDVESLGPASGANCEQLQSIQFSRCGLVPLSPPDVFNMRLNTTGDVMFLTCGGRSVDPCINRAAKRP